MVLGIAIGLIIGGCVGFLIACILVAAGSDAARHHDDGRLS